MKLGEHQERFSEDLCQLLTYAMSHGYKVRMGEVERPLAMQEVYFKTGRSKTMNSMHLKKCAVDLHFFKDGQICYPKELGDFWEALDPLNRWGGNWKDFKDGPHFERRA
jgi:peptidoglycan L-alanyl-D-glutamate endopeptidase CwlK